MAGRGAAIMWVAMILLEADPAFAYLDPGTGSALVCVLVSVATAATYMARTVVYAVRGKWRDRNAAPAERTRARDDAGLLVFSEGRDYWPTFKPVVEALLARDIRFRYWSMDVEDPALALEDPRMDARYIGHGALAYGRVAAARAGVMLATTPNIGCPGFPIPKPTHVDCLAHVLHGCCDITYYRRHSLDHYDAVFTLGPAMEKSVRRLEALRGLPAKTCVVAGAPNLDGLARNTRSASAGPRGRARPVVVLAPTWGMKGFLRTCGVAFIEALARDGAYELILRPHPQSWRKEPRFMRGVAERLSACGVAVDRALSPADTFDRADLLISDISGIRFEFAFLRERPVITLAVPAEDEAAFEAADLPDSWEYDAAPRIGAVLTPDTLADLPSAVARALAKPPADFAAVRGEYLHNPGHAGEAIADWLAARLAECEKEKAQS